MGEHKVRTKNLKKLKALGGQIKKLRVERNMTQEQVANIARISENTVVTIEQGRVNTSVATCFELAKALNVHPKDLFDF